MIGRDRSSGIEMSHPRAYIAAPVRGGEGWGGVAEWSKAAVLKTAG